MKVCVTAQGEGLEAPVDPRFGRARSFVLVDTRTLTTETIENTGADADHGAGINAGMTLARSGVRALLTGHVGPKAHDVLKAAGIEVYAGASGTVREAVAAFLDGKLHKASNAGSTGSRR
ncbi:MAG TPA: dinitrogenase iron-molybdenum cofactor biosynthesis protein [Acidobacteria bacterium]|nr:dinitrogenase iron-molybdenum cofactor biosynthesis protein [Acidobacteriota bacterium]